MKKYSTLIYCLLFFVLSYGSLFPQSALRRGVKFGVEFKDYLSGKNGSFSNSPDFEFGLFTGIKLYNTEKNALFLKLELNYVRLTGYRINKVYHLISIHDQAPFDITEDERFESSFVELGIMPEYFFILNNETLVSLFLGPSIGFGGKDVKVNKISHPWEYDNFDEYGMGFSLAESLNAGVNLYYKIFFVGIKYRYSYIANTHINDYNKISLLAGFAFD
jgi:hypothetical protein